MALISKKQGYLARSLGEAFHGGIVMFTGREVLPFGPKLHAVPVSALWQGLG